jgi:hypothetical protein
VHSRQSFGFGAAHTRANFERPSVRTLARWTAPLGGPVESTPAVVDGTVYIRNDDGVTAHDRARYPTVR